MLQILKRLDWKWRPAQRIGMLIAAGVILYVDKTWIWEQKQSFSTVLLLFALSVGMLFLGEKIDNCFNTERYVAKLIRLLKKA